MIAGGQGRYFPVQEPKHPIHLCIIVKYTILQANTRVNDREQEGWGTMPRSSSAPVFCSLGQTIRLICLACAVQHSSFDILKQMIRCFIVQADCDFLKITTDNGIMLAGVNEWVKYP